MVAGPVKGPKLSPRTSQASASNESTVRSISLSKLALTPDISRPSANTSAVASDADREPAPAPLQLPQADQPGHPPILTGFVSTSRAIPQAVPPACERVGPLR